MTFDFTNYTFSGLMSVLAALYGIGYPLIIQSIERIYSQYDSSLLADRFTKEPIYRLFQVLLVCNLAFAVCCPFLLHANWWNWGVITIQAILLSLLMGCTFILFQLMIKYGNAGKLLVHLKGRQVDNTNVMDILDLAIYADSKNNIQLFSECMTIVFEYFVVQQGDKYDGTQKEDTLPPVVYDQTSLQILQKIKKYIREDDGHHLLYRNADVISILYNQISKSIVDINTHKQVWGLLNEAITNSNHSWFKQYWQFADSFASLKYRFPSTDELRYGKKYFMLRHVMVGALLLHSDKLHWLNDIFFYTHSEPEYYGLIPSSFSEILEMLENVDVVCKGVEFFKHGFYFANEMSGVKDDRYVFREAVRYLSLLVIRLWSLENRNLHFYEGVFNVPLPPVLISEDGRASQLMDMMKNDVESYYGHDIFNVIPRLSKVDIEKPLALLDEYKQKCDYAKQYNSEHPIVDSKKFEKLMEEARMFANDFSQTLKTFPTVDQTRRLISHTKLVSNSEQLDTINYSPYKEMVITDNTIWKNFQFEVSRYYDQVIRTMPILANYIVPRDQISIFLDEIGYSLDRYLVLATEPIDEVEGIVNMQAFYRPATFYIMIKEDAPVLSLKSVENDKLHPIIDQEVISSNIFHFRECNALSFDLVVASEVNVSSYEDAKGIIMVKIDDNNLKQGSHVSVNTSLGDLFGLRQLSSPD